MYTLYMGDDSVSVEGSQVAIMLEAGWSITPTAVEEPAAVEGSEPEDTGTPVNRRFAATE